MTDQNHGLAVGVFLPTASAPGGLPGDIAAAARHAEQLSFESVWAVDQLVLGTGAPILDSTLALAAAAAVTSRVRLGLGVMIVPLRPAAWVAKQVATLQHISAGRLLLGVGVGGARHDRSWVAAGVPTRGRGRRLDAVLEALPELLAGRPAQIQPGEPPVEFAPAAVMPPVLVGGNSEAALGRAAKHGSGWWPLGGTPEEIAAARTRLAEMARAHDRPVPALNGSLMTAVSGDPALPSRDVLLRELEDPDGPYGIPAEAIGQMFSNDTPAELAERMEAWAQIGVERVIVTLAGGDWFRQAELLAEARRLLPGVAAVRACPG